jgi:hypothetical protein
MKEMKKWMASKRNMRYNDGPLYFTSAEEQLKQYYILTCTIPLPYIQTGPHIMGFNIPLQFP